MMTRRRSAANPSTVALATVFLAFSACRAAGQTAGRTAGQTADSGGSALDLRWMNDASSAASRGRYTDAIAFASRAVGNTPQFAAGYLARASLLMGAGRYREALADLAHVERLHPDTANVFIARAEIAVRQHDGGRALAELAHAAAAPTASAFKQSYEASLGDAGGGHVAFSLVTSYTASTMYAYRSIAQELQGHDDAALDDLQNALRNETEFPAYVLGAHCYSAAIAGLLDMAELTCTEAIERQSYDSGNYDSRGFVHLRMHAWDKAIADYDRALAARPDLTLSLYGRGIARRARGDSIGGNADIAAARKGEPDIANIMARLGVPPI